MRLYTISVLVIFAFFAREVCGACNVNNVRKNVAKQFRTLIYNGVNQKQSEEVLKMMVDIYINRTDGLDRWLEEHLNAAIQASDKMNVYLNQVNAAYKEMGDSLFGTAYANQCSTFNKLFKPFFEKAVKAFNNNKKAKPGVRNCKIMNAMKRFFVKKLAKQWNADFKKSVPAAVYDTYKSYMKVVFPWLKL